MSINNNCIEEDFNIIQVHDDFSEKNLLTIGSDKSFDENNNSKLFEKENSETALDAIISNEDKNIFKGKFDENNRDEKTNQIIENFNETKESNIDKSKDISIVNEEISENILNTSNLLFKETISELSENVIEEKSLNSSECLKVNDATRDINESFLAPEHEDKKSLEALESNCDVLDVRGDGYLIKQIITRGLGCGTRPREGDHVKIEYQSWDSMNIPIDNYTDTFILGDGDVIEAVELALYHAELEEEFQLVTDARYAYGEYGMVPDVQPNEQMTLRIKLLASGPAPNYAEFSPNDRLMAVKKKRKRANFFYDRGEYQKAIKSYLLAMKIISTDPDFKNSFLDSPKSKIFVQFMKVTSNLAVSKLKLEMFHEAIETCNDILKLDPNNVKALFRKGISLCRLGVHKEALIILREASRLDRNNNFILDEIKKCEGNLCRPLTCSKNSYSKYSPYVGLVFVASISIVVFRVVLSKYRAR